MKAPKMVQLFLMKENKGHGPLWDKFAMDFESFQDMIEDVADYQFGQGWKQQIDQAQGWTGATDWFIKQHWDGNWSLWETMKQLEFMYDAYLRDRLDPDTVHANYSNLHMIQGQNTVGRAYDPVSDTFRTKRPSSPADFGGTHLNFNED